MSLTPDVIVVGRLDAEISRKESVQLQNVDLKQFESIAAADNLYASLVRPRMKNIAIVTSSVSDQRSQSARPELPTSRDRMSHPSSSVNRIHKPSGSVAIDAKSSSSVSKTVSDSPQHSGRPLTAHRATSTSLYRYEPPPFVDPHIEALAAMKAKRREDAEKRHRIAVEYMTAKRHKSCVENNKAGEDPAAELRAMRKKEAEKRHDAAVRYMEEKRKQARKSQPSNASETDAILMRRMNAKKESEARQQEIIRKVQRKKKRPSKGPEETSDGLYSNAAPALTCLDNRIVDDERRKRVVSAALFLQDRLSRLCTKCSESTASFVRDGGPLEAVDTSVSDGSDDDDLDSVVTDLLDFPTVAPLDDAERVVNSISSSAPDPPVEQDSGNSISNGGQDSSMSVADAVADDHTDVDNTALPAFDDVAVGVASSEHCLSSNVHDSPQLVLMSAPVADPVSVDRSDSMADPFLSGLEKTGSDPSVRASVSEATSNHVKPADSVSTSSVISAREVGLQHSSVETSTLELLDVGTSPVSSMDASPGVSLFPLPPQSLGPRKVDRSLKDVLASVLQQPVRQESSRSSVVDLLYRKALARRTPSTPVKTDETFLSSSADVYSPTKLLPEQSVSAASSPVRPSMYPFTLPGVMGGPPSPSDSEDAFSSYLSSESSIDASTTQPRMSPRSLYQRFRSQMDFLSAVQVLESKITNLQSSHPRHSFAHHVMPVSTTAVVNRPPTVEDGVQTSDATNRDHWTAQSTDKSLQTSPSSDRMSTAPPMGSQVVVVLAPGKSPVLPAADSYHGVEDSILNASKAVSSSPVVYAGMSESRTDMPPAPSLAPFRMDGVEGPVLDSFPTKDESPKFVSQDRESVASVVEEDFWDERTDGSVASDVSLVKTGRRTDRHDTDAYSSDVYSDTFESEDRSSIASAFEGESSVPDSIAVQTTASDTPRGKNAHIHHPDERTRDNRFDMVEDVIIEEPHLISASPRKEVPEVDEASSNDFNVTEADTFEKTEDNFLLTASAVEEDVLDVGSTVIEEDVSLLRHVEHHSVRSSESGNTEVDSDALEMGSRDSVISAVDHNTVVAEDDITHAVPVGKSVDRVGSPPMGNGNTEVYSDTFEEEEHSSCASLVEEEIFAEEHHPTLSSLDTESAAVDDSNRKEENRLLLVSADGQANERMLSSSDKAFVNVGGIHQHDTYSDSFEDEDRMSLAATTEQAQIEEECVVTSTELSGLTVAERDASPTRESRDHDVYSEAFESLDRMSLASMVESDAVQDVSQISVQSPETESEGHGVNDPGQYVPESGTCAEEGWTTHDTVHGEIVGSVGMLIVGTSITEDFGNSLSQDSEDSVDASAGDISIALDKVFVEVPAEPETVSMAQSFEGSQDGHLDVEDTDTEIRADAVTDVGFCPAKITADTHDGASSVLVQAPMDSVSVSSQPDYDDVMDQISDDELEAVSASVDDLIVIRTQLENGGDSSVVAHVDVTVADQRMQSSSRVGAVTTSDKDASLVLTDFSDQLFQSILLDSIAPLLSENLVIVAAADGSSTTSADSHVSLAVEHRPLERPTSRHVQPLLSEDSSGSLSDSLFQRILRDEVDLLLTEGLLLEAARSLSPSMSEVAVPPQTVSDDVSEEEYDDMIVHENVEQTAVPSFRAHSSSSDSLEENRGIDVTKEYVHAYVRSLVDSFLQTGIQQQGFDWILPLSAFLSVSIVQAPEHVQIYHKCLFDATQQALTCFAALLQGSIPENVPLPDALRGVGARLRYSSKYHWKENCKDFVERAVWFWISGMRIASSETVRVRALEEMRLRTDEWIRFSSEEDHLLSLVSDMVLQDLLQDTAEELQLMVSAD